MFKEQLLSYARHIPLLAAVEATFAEKGLLMQLVLLKRKGNAIEVLRREGDIPTVEKLLSILPKGVPIALSLNGKGIIHRFVRSVDLKDDMDLLRLILPNAKKQDFYLQKNSQSVMEVLSVIRRDRLDELLLHVAKIQEQLLSVSLGPFHIASLLPAVVKEGSELLQVARHHFELKENEIISYQWEEAEQPGRIIRIGDEEMNERFLVAFALGFLVLSEMPMATLAVDSLAGRIEDKRQEWFFKRSALLLGVFFLLILLLNTFYFLHYNGKMADTSLSDVSLLDKEIKQLKDVLKGQEQLVEVINYTERGDKEPLSYIADQLGASVPKYISLDELNFFPQDEIASRKERRPKYQSGLIRITGTTETIGALNHWVKVISMMSFSKEVALVDYKYDEKQERGVFNLKLILR
ncbi:hypothetical protein FKG96_06105 [Olivibacter sp. LS-1]|uniref:hypothetical protein n=1 Tax=Olivibacter sp. LS-1 TaxID=2592345 RepID=UPI0011EB2CD5|nr:hypothetical protein [Olivibacter sp. LS-1]QEL00398.1 hypothetical protein FKG96_06105 [Olivibacter sp. LS-1]